MPGYRAIHYWVERQLGKAAEHTCEQEDETCSGRMEWANISREYHRDVDDWLVLCHAHHKRRDMAEREALGIPVNYPAHRKSRVAA